MAIGTRTTTSTLSDMSAVVIASAISQINLPAWGTEQHYMADYGEREGDSWGAQIEEVRPYSAPVGLKLVDTSKKFRLDRRYVFTK